MPRRTDDLLAGHIERATPPRRPRWRAHAAAALGWVVILALALGLLVIL